MNRKKLGPSHELLKKAMFVADTKNQLPSETRHVLSDWGLYCYVNRLPGGALFYHAGGKFRRRLQFTVGKNGSISVQKYQRGDWEHALDRTYNYAEFLGRYVREQRQLEQLGQLLNDILSTPNKLCFEQAIQRSEKMVSESPDNLSGHLISALGDLYPAVGRFKDAEGIYIEYVEIWSNVCVPHHLLALFYLHALAHQKLLELAPSLAKGKYADLTLQDLGCTYKQVHHLVEKHIKNALTLVPPEHSAMHSSLAGMLSELKRIDKAPFQRKELELAQACRMLQERPEEATNTLETIVDRNPNFAPGWGNLAMAYMEAGRAKDAQRALMKAINMDPRTPGWHIGLSTLYCYALGNAKVNAKESRKFLRSLAEDGIRAPSELLKTPELPEYMGEITLEALGCSYKYAGQMAERHAKEVLKLAKKGESGRELRRAASNNLAHIRMMDEVRHDGKHKQQ